MASNGDIALVGYFSDGTTAGTDTFSFVILADLSGQTINFTDNGWLSSGAFRTGEGIVSYTVPAGTPIGTVVTLSGGGSFNLSTGGDQIIAYTGTLASPTAILFGLDFANAAGWDATAADTNTSAVPPPLVAGTDALSFSTDNGAYTGPTTGTRAQILANIANPANWTTSDTAAVAYPGNFTVSSGPPTGEFSIADAAAVAEGNSGTTAVVFTVTRSGGSNGAATVDYAVNFPGGAGVADAADFSGAVAGTVSFAHGETSKTITVNVAGDFVIEPDETFTVTLSNAISGTTVSSTNGTAGSTIQNDDAPGTISVADTSQAEGDSGTTPGAFTLTRTGGASGAVSVDYTITLPGGAGGADGTDVTATLTGTVNFAEGATSATIPFTVNGDTAVEPDETFTVALSNAQGGAAIGTGNATATITNDDTATPVPGVLSIADSSVTEGNSGTSPINFTVTRASGDDGAVGATWTVTLVSADASDFAPAQTFSGTVSFADGDTSETITLNVAGDTAIEGDETFTVTLSAPTGGATLDDDSATGTITNDDALPANVFINEIHYDDVSSDSGEAVEIAGTAGTNLSGWSLVFYNLTNGAAYATINLSGVIPNQDDGYGTLSFAGPAAGIQNGPQDGIALVNGSGAVVQFLSYEGTVTATDGPAIGMTSTDIGVSEDPPVSDGFSLQLVGTGASYADFTWGAAKANTFGAVNSSQDFLGTSATGLVSVRDTSVAEGNSGTTNLVFTVHRAGGLGQTASVDYAISLTGTANAADIGPGAVFSGTVTFDPGVSAVQVVVPIQGDTDGEANETLFITLSNPVGNITVTDSSATGTIRNDDGVFAPIFEIQGASHTSPLVNQQVTTTGIVTAVDSNGYYLQDAGGDGNNATSDGIFVFTSGAPTITVNGTPEPIMVGDFLTVTGTVAEFQANAASLTVTEIINSTAVRNTSGNSLPNAIVIGTGGRTPPTENYENDNFTSFDPATDALDFYESMEGMRVTIDNPLVVADTNGFGETYVVASGGAGATGVNARKGITVSEGDFNPERIQIDDDSNLSPGSYNPDHSQGDELGDVTGILNYAFTSYEVLVTAPVTVTNDVDLGQETTALDGDSTHLTVASYNVENLDPTDPQSKFDAIASQIVNNLSAPDIIGLQEVQDADGAGNGSNLSGQATADKLIAAIVAAGGPTYQYVEVAPSTANDTGGEPGGNIRNGYLYNPARVTYVPGSAELVEAPAYDGTRRPLAADFVFNGETVTVINVHFTSRGGSDPLMGDNQPPNNAGDSARLAQAQALRAYIDGLAAGDPELNIVTLGDFNSFYWEAPLQTIQAGGAQNNLHLLLPEEERYSYMFEGNLQALDNILVGPNLNLTSEFDPVHLNAEQPAGPNKPTDHDPSVAEILISANDVISSTSGNDVRRSGAGNDLFYLHLGGNDNASGGPGDDIFYFGSTFTGADTVDADGGVGDVVVLQGNYTLTLSPTNLTGVEALSLKSGAFTTYGDTANNFYDYAITTVDENVAPGAQFIVNASSLRVGEDFAFNGSAETDGKFLVLGGRGVDTLTGGAGNDIFSFEGGSWGASDSVNGGGGRDSVVISNGNGLTHIEFGATSLINVESVTVSNRYSSDPTATPDYEFVLHDGNVAAGQTLIVNGATLTDPGQTISIDGSDEQDGNLILFGGAGSDVLIGGDGNDVLYGAGLNDMLTGGDGNDVFRYDAISDSTPANRDEIEDFTLGDLIDLSRIDADSTQAGNQAFNFIGTGAFTNQAGQLRYENISAGGSTWVIQGDTDGVNGADFEIVVVIPDLDPITAGDFIL